METQIPWKAYTFSGGPTCLPREVIGQAQKEFLNWKGTGISILETYNKSPLYEELLKETEQDLRDLYGIPNNQRVFFCAGGGTLQFAALPLNLLKGKTVANYVNTGYWSRKAIEEAVIHCKVQEVAHVEKNEKGLFHVPSQENWKVDPNSSQIHFCDNETVEGLEFQQVPQVKGQWTVADLSSNFLTRPVDWSKFDVVQAHAQKNVGVAGSTVLIIKESLIDGNKPVHTPYMCDYEVYAKTNGIVNTPPTFPIYINHLTFKYIKKMGGVSYWNENRTRGSKLLYDAIDNSHGFYQNEVDPSFRSRINVTWRLKDKSLDEKMIEEAHKVGILEIKGHRSIGGFRASIYIPVPDEGIKKLKDFMEDFAAKHQS